MILPAVSARYLKFYKYNPGATILFKFSLIIYFSTYYVYHVGLYIIFNNVMR